MSLCLPIRRCAFWSRNWARDFRTNATQHSLRVTDKITLLITCISNRLEFFSDDLKLLTWQHNIVANDNANESQKEFVLRPYCFKQTVWRKGLCLYGIKLLKVVHKTNVLPFEKYIQWSIASIESKIKIEWRNYLGRSAVSACGLTKKLGWNFKCACVNWNSEKELNSPYLKNLNSWRNWSACMSNCALLYWNSVDGYRLQPRSAVRIYMYISHTFSEIVEDILCKVTIK